MKRNARSERARVLGVPVTSVTPDDLQRQILHTVRAGERARLLNVNAHALNLSYELPWLREYFNEAELVFADGYGAVWAARLLGSPMKPRITYADWFWRLAGFAAQQEISVYFLGARPGVAEQARAVLQGRFPTLPVVGIHHGYFDRSSGSAENQRVVDAINAAGPNILVVAMGMPRQERWLHDNWDRLNANVALTGGAVFDYVSGRLRRPPRVLTERGLEWLGRLLIEPARLWRRYLIGNPKFVWRVIQQKLGNGGSSSGTSE